ncbi:uncharacterized protein L969DRAFT_101695 [Mixia osmundae IAM 14324]|uniref:STAS domain-containing protein n=1 Tax=Mixia osmundae (strain CBS 9802 / IAM 14324 / JCM 22182 / KY 12970) TaxID=764103 RepID=G7DYD3_MIXOS|nr:uncharacterized protein L969DRAFT_101695 [Mixia osmundae IAM 14324]KEI41496.1 hypothetical protein L969DRAFT_101695 [Mixia osmundae IAM 14324]GAA95593.1 hypothetical protein E5Q_02249 [Mixia osmundae IAM 14324]
MSYYIGASPGHRRTGLRASLNTTRGKAGAAAFVLGSIWCTLVLQAQHLLDRERSPLRPDFGTQARASVGNLTLASDFSTANATEDAPLTGDLSSILKHLDSWDPLRPNSLPITSIEVRSCYFSPELYDACQPEATPRDEQIYGKWVRVNKDVNIRRGVWYTYVYYRRQHPFMSHPTVREMQLVQQDHADEITLASQGWTMAQGNLRSGVWPQQKGLRIWYLLKPYHSDLSDPPITEIDVLYGETANSTLPGFTKLSSRITEYEGAKRSGVDLVFRKGISTLPRKPDLTFTSDGKFRIMQIADLHFSVDRGTCRDVNTNATCDARGADRFTLDWLHDAIDTEQPDLVVLSGDQLNGQSTSYDALSVILKVANLFAHRTIPWTVVFGNHDSEATDADRAMQMSMYQALPYFVGEAGPDHVDGIGNYMLSVRSHDQTKTSLLSLYFLDSHTKEPGLFGRGYQALKPSQLSWYRDTSSLVKTIMRPYRAPVMEDFPTITDGRQRKRRSRISRRQFDGQTLKKPNAMVFFHIPLIEAFDEPDKSENGEPLKMGVQLEGSGASNTNSHFLTEALLQQTEYGSRDAEDMQDIRGDILPEAKVLVHGHDHITERCARIKHIWMCFSGGSSYSGYGAFGFDKRVRVFDVSDYGETIKTWKFLDLRESQKTAELTGVTYVSEKEIDELASADNREHEAEANDVKLTDPPPVLAEIPAGSPPVAIAPYTPNLADGTVHIAPNVPLLADDHLDRRAKEETIIASVLDAYKNLNGRRLDEVILVGENAERQLAIMSKTKDLLRKTLHIEPTEPQEARVTRGESIASRDDIDPYLETDPTVSGWIKDHTPGKREVKEYILSLFPFVEWLPRYNTTWLIGDLIAGITVGAVVVPQGMAYAKLAQLPVQYGLYSSFVGVLIYWFFATSKDITIGPVAVMSQLVGNIVIQVQQTRPDIPGYQIGSALAVLAGAFVFVLGILRLGFIVDFIPLPAIAAFMTGSALSIASGQVVTMMGLSGVANRGPTYQIVIHILKHLGRTHLDAAIGLTALLMLYLIRYFAAFIGRRAPRYQRLMFFVSTLRTVFVILLYTLISWLVNRHHNAKTTDHKWAILGSVPRGFKQMGAPVMTHELISLFADQLPATVIVLLIEHIAIAKSFGRVNNYVINPSQELIAIGITNLFGPFFGAYPATGSFSRTAIKSKAGVRTPLAGLITAIVVLLALYALPAVFFWIPNAVLAAVIIHAVLDLITPPSVVWGFWLVSPLEVVIYFAGVLVTVFSSIENGIYVAIASSGGLLLYRIAKAHGQLLGRIRVTTVNGQDSRNIYLPLDHVDGSNPAVDLEAPAPGVFVYRLTSDFLYPNGYHYTDELLAQIFSLTKRADVGTIPKLGDRPWNMPGPRHIDEQAIREDSRPTLKALILDFTNVTHIDVTALQILVDVRDQLNRYAAPELVPIHFASVKSRWAKRALAAFGFGKPYNDDVRNVFSISEVGTAKGQNLGPAASRPHDTEQGISTMRDEAVTSRGLPLLSSDRPLFHADLDEALAQVLDNLGLANDQSGYGADYKEKDISPPESAAGIHY